MLSAIVAPLAAGELPVWVASTIDGDLVLVPATLLNEGIDMLRHAGHHRWIHPVDATRSCFRVERWEIGWRRGGVGVAGIGGCRRGSARRLWRGSGRVLRLGR